MPLDAPRLALSAAIAAGAVLTIRAEYRGPRRRVYLFKPLTTALVLALALAAPVPSSARYERAVAVGLLFSLSGDVFLMLPGDRFVAGLASFLVAHLAYLVAFTSDVRVGAVAWPLLPYVAAAGVLVATLWSRLGRLRGPVLAYVAVIVVMASQAAARAVVVGDAPSLLAAGGAALFVVSDATLALARFGGTWPSAQAIVLATYFAAQWMIALSVGTLAG